MTIRLFIQKALSLAKWLVIPGKYDELDPNDIVTRRKRKTRYVILGASILFAIMTAAAILLQDSGVDAPISNDIAVALVLNLNLILLVVMVLLVVRNIVKLYFERRGGMAGSRFQTKLVIAFLAMTLIPSALMFAVASELISDTVDKWINSQIEQTLQESLQVAESLYRDSENKTTARAMYISRLIEKRALTGKRRRGKLSAILKQKISEYDVDMIQVYNADFELISQAVKYPSSGVISFNLKTHSEMLAKAALGEAVSKVEERGENNLAISVMPTPPNLKSGEVKGVVVVIKLVSQEMIEKVHSIVNAFQDYKQLTLKKEIIKASYQVTLTLVTLVVVFSAIWFGFYIAKGITVPLKKLSEATESVAKGNLDVRVDIPAKNDEIGRLINAFNNMTLDLKNFKEQIERSNKELSESNTELYHRGQYIEAVLENVGGVISIDKTGEITTINESAAGTFGVSRSKARGRNYKKIFESSHLSAIRKVIREMSDAGGKTIEREINMSVNGRRRTLKTSVSVLTDHNGQYMGMVFVFDDVTDLIAAQRTIAWREMARQIAHEIKNPLTPIQLNAQRMRRKYQQKAEDFPKVLDDATNIIIQEVDQLKTLVDRFSKFARQSDTASLELRPEPNLMHDLVFEIVKLYKDTAPGVKLLTDLDPSIQLVNIDAEQIRRVIINLVENAMDALNGGGEITICTRANHQEGKVILEVSDTGHGVPESIKNNIFKPYFSTKEKGTGLGLAIVSRVVEDHGGKIYVNDNSPKGSRFTIELSIE
ncbi:MAG TPA: PAS domain S-box protein [Nitrospirae bacterium]|nr:PAS domain S-box protein [Nitrospirota bacterium]